MNCLSYLVLLLSILNCLVIIVIGKECGTIDVRNNPSSLMQLTNCTVIIGYLQVVLIQGKYSNKDYENYTFPALREITEFVIFFDVTGLTSLGQLFPNLTVIRGKKLFLNYALAIDSMPDLRTLDLKSLVSIQRGSVYINRNSKLCYLENVNWDRLTENKVGLNVYKSQQPTDCLGLRGCDYYWSYRYCQKFQNDNVISTIKASQCHPQCLGGCRNFTNADCAVCKGITDNGHCVEKCPADKYFDQDLFRCYTKATCIETGRYILNNTCVRQCPPGYTDYKTVVNDTHSINDFICHVCGECPRICHTYDEIQYLSDAELLKGCSIIKGNLTIRIMSKINNDYLESALGDIVEIHNFLKIYRTVSITSLNFLRNLKIIHGDSLEFDHYGLVLYENENLKNLWNWTTHSNILIKKGGIFLHSNYKLCSHEILKLHQYIEHDNSTDSINENSEEILCDPMELKASVTVESHEAVLIEWSKSENTDRTQLLYRKIPNPNISLNDVYEDNVCFKEIWTKELLFHDELQSNNSNWIYSLNELEQNQWYALVIKTYGQNNSQYHSSKSDLIRFKTNPDIPLSPQVYTLAKTPNSITLTWRQVTDEHQLIENYLIDIFYQPDNQEILDTRNYCTDPLKQTSSSNLNGKIDDQYENTENDDYDNCCNRIEDELEDREFISLIDDKFRCSQDTNFADSCKIVKYHTRLRRSVGQELIPDAYNSKYLIKSEVIDNVKSFEIHNLTHYTLYIFQFFACNEIGCGAYGLHSDRTAPLPSADDVHLTIEKGDQKNQYLLYFPQPKTPNGVTVAFNVEYRIVNGGNFTGAINCITRHEHGKHNFRYPIYVEHKNFSARVRSISLAGPGAATDWILYTVGDDEDDVIDSYQKAGMDPFVVFCLVCLCCMIPALGWMAYKRIILSKSTEPNIDEQILMQEFETNYFDDSIQDNDL